MPDKTYSQGHDKSVLASHGARNAQNTCGYYAHLLKPHFHLLDVGCGPGSITSSLAVLLPQGRVVGIENGENILEAARSRPNLPSNCSFELGDAYNLPFPDDTFDVVQTSQVMIHLTDPAAAITELRRVCKRGGFVACSEADWDAMMIFPMNRGLELAHTVGKMNFSYTGAQPSAGRELLSWTLKAGFQRHDVEYSVSARTHTGDNAEGFGKNQADRTEHDQVWRDNVKHRGLATDDDLEVMRLGWLDWAKQPDAAHTVMNGQVVCHK